MNAFHFNKQILTSIAFLLEMVAMLVDGLLGCAFQTIGKKIINTNQSIWSIIFFAFLQFIFITSFSQLVLEKLGLDISLFLEMCIYCWGNYKASFLFLGVLFFFSIFFKLYFLENDSDRNSIVAKTHTECSISHIFIKIKFYKTLIVSDMGFGIPIEISNIKQ